MEQRNEDMGEINKIIDAAVGATDREAMLIGSNMALREEVNTLKAECQELRSIIKMQAKAFADSQRAAPFEDAVKALLAKEFHEMTLKMIKKLKNDGFFSQETPFNKADPRTDQPIGL